MNATVVAAIIAGGLTLIGTVATQILGRRATKRDLIKQGEQLDRTLAEQRTRTLNERFATAATQLGGDKPPAVRLAGVYAMAGLADDWPENRQTCVDVLCAHLRMPYYPDPGQRAPESERLAYRANREVRHTVIRVITAHLREGAAVSWQGLNFDFTGVAFDGGDFTDAKFSGGEVSFDGATFSGGEVNFRGATFSGGEVNFHGATFSGGRVSFDGATFSGWIGFLFAEFSGGRVSFDGATFSGGEVSFDGATFSGGEVRFFHATFSGGEVSFTRATFSGAKVFFTGARFSGGDVDFIGAKFCSSMVRFMNATFSGGDVDFSYAEFSGGLTSFFNATFSGGLVGFMNATFSGGEVGFSRAADWSVPPEFPWTDAPPPGVKLPKKEDQSQP